MSSTAYIHYLFCSQNWQCREFRCFFTQTYTTVSCRDLVEEELSRLIPQESVSGRTHPSSRQAGRLEPVTHLFRTHLHPFATCL